MKPSVLWPAALATVLLGCGHSTEHFVLPDRVTDFSALYESNCSGCHGRDGSHGAARPLNDPNYLALVGKEKLRDVVANGVPRTAMPAFAKNAGGSLTDQQINVLTDQMEARWSRPLDLQIVLPPYSAELGDRKRGEEVFRGLCSKCHGESGIGGSLVDAAFLTLASDQSLRITVIAGRVDRGMPDWRSHSPGPAMTPQQVSDVVAWLSAHRANSVKARGETKLP